MTLTEAKARFSEVVRSVRQSRTPLIVTVDGEPAVAITPMMGTTARLDARQIRIVRALEDAILRMPKQGDEFDAVELVRDGRR